MTRIIHLSDLHFGAHDDRLVAAVERRIDEETPDLVVVSGDFTQRARLGQYRAARAFLDRLTAEYARSHAQWQQVLARVGAGDA